MLADLRLSPDLQRPDLREPRAQLHRDQLLARALAEADHGVERRVRVHFLVLDLGWRELHHLAQHILGARERAVEPELHRTVGHQLQVLEIEIERGALFRAARHQAHRARPGAGLRSDADVVGARQPSAHQHARSSASREGVIRRAHGHRKVEIAVLENHRPAAVPALDNVGHSLAADIRNEEAAVEENRIHAVRRVFGRAAQERRQVASHRGV